MSNAKKYTVRISGESAFPLRGSASKRALKSPQVLMCWMVNLQMRIGCVDSSAGGLLSQTDEGASCCLATGVQVWPGLQCFWTVRDCFSS